MPFQTVGSFWFRWTLKDICPGFKVPDRETVSRLVRRQHADTRDELEREIGKSGGLVSLTADVWTSARQLSFVGITAHWIDDNFVYCSVPLDLYPLDGDHSGSSICQAVISVCISFGIVERVHTITLDNASASTRAVELLEAEFRSLGGGFYASSGHIRCLAHVLNLSAQSLIKAVDRQALHMRRGRLGAQTDTKATQATEAAQPQQPGDLDSASIVAAAVHRLRRIHAAVRRSSTLGSAFKDICARIGCAYLSLTLDCATRWNSTVSMIKRGLKMKDCINELVEGQEDLQPLDNVHWQHLELLVADLVPFEQATLALSPDKTITIPAAIPSFDFVIDRLRTSAALPAAKDADGAVAAAAQVVPESYADVLRAGTRKLRQYNSAASTSYAYVVGMVLDPRYMLSYHDTTPWHSRLQAVAIVRQVYTRYKSRHGSMSVNTTTRQAVPPAAGWKAIWSTAASQTAQPQLPSDELERYLGETRAPYTANVFDWWRAKKTDYPVLARMAQDYLATPATSAASEQLFSQAGRISTRARSRLSAESIRTQTLMCVWLALQRPSTTL